MAAYTRYVRGLYQITIPNHRMIGCRIHVIALSYAAAGKVIRNINQRRIKNALTPHIDPQQDGRVATPHGFRSTFKDWPTKNTQFKDEASEIAFAYSFNDKTRSLPAFLHYLKNAQKLWLLGVITA